MPNYTFSKTTVAEFYGIEFYAIINHEGKTVAYSERVFEIPKEVQFYGPDKCLIFEKAVIMGGVIRGGEIWGGVIRGGEIWGGVIWGGVIWGGEIRGGEIWGGVIRGGVIWGGEIRGGVIWGGEIRGGVIRDGVIWGGVIWGGVIWGGVIRGGEIWGGVIRDGVIRGGVIWGGVIRGGEIRGGVYEISLLQIQGTRHYCYATPTDSGEIQLGIGCHIHSIEFWVENYQSIGENESYSAEEISEYWQYIQLFAARYSNQNQSKI